jgi:hypothetical protein
MSLGTCPLGEHARGEDSAGHLIEAAVVDQGARGCLGLCQCDRGGCDDQHRADDSQSDRPSHRHHAGYYEAKGIVDFPARQQLLLP